jgi:urea transport system substrate-binding protein
MAAIALTKAGDVSTKALRQNLKGVTFDKAPQGTVSMREKDNQAVVPSYLMKVRDNWTGVDDMFEKIQSIDQATPVDARCDLPL